MKRKNLILSILHNYDYPFIEPFISSLKKTGYSDDLIIFTSSTVSKTTKAKLKRQGAVLKEFDPLRPFLNEIYPNISSRISINNYRFLLYLQFLEKNHNSYQNVMITDIRDVIFQNHPFTHIQSDKLYFFLEDPNQTFKNSELNYQWYKEACNTTYNKFDILNKVVSCAGITIGNVNSIINYLIFIKKNLEGRIKLEWGLDQGIHNLYIYNDCSDVSERIIIGNESNIVGTLGANSEYHLDSLGYILNNNGEKYDIIHQYDRFAPLLSFIKRKYIGHRIIQVIKRIFFTIAP